jgi:HEAT repeat protein
VPYFLSWKLRKWRKGKIAYEEIAGYGSAALPGVLETLGDSESAARARAAEALGLIGDTRAVSSLGKALKDPDHSTRAKAAEALGLIGDVSAVPALIGALKQQSWAVCCSVERALGRLRDPRAVKPILDVLRSGSEHPLARLEAMKALLSIGDPAAAHDIFLLMFDSQEAVKLAAREAIPQIADLLPVRDLLAILRDSSESEHGIAERVIRQRGAEAIPALVEFLESPFRQTAAGMLAELGWKPSSGAERALFLVAAGRCDEVTSEDAAAVGPILRLFRAEPGDRAIATALCAFKDDAVGELNALLLEQRGTEYWASYDRRVGPAAEILGCIGHRSSLEPLCSALRSVGSNDVRKTIIAAIGKIDNRRAIDEARDLLRGYFFREESMQRDIKESLIDLNDAATIQSLVPSLSPDVDPRLEYLAEKSPRRLSNEQLRSARHDVDPDLLEYLLKKSPDHLSNEQLMLIMELKDFAYTIGATDTFNGHDVRRDFSAARKLARDMLAARRLQKGRSA